MITATIQDLASDFDKVLHDAAGEDVLVLRQGRPAAVIHALSDEDDLHDYRVEHDPRFLHRVTASRQSAKEGRVKTLDQIEAEEAGRETKAS
jgi:antitoxin (DNA-binding transcriptional repressor) of toxin-antitoxin stability system